MFLHTDDTDFTDVLLSAELRRNLNGCFWHTDLTDDLLSAELRRNLNGDSGAS